MLICDVSALNKFGKHALDRHLQPLGLCWQEMVALMTLRHKPDADHALLTLMLQTDKGNVTKLLDRMEGKGLLARRRSREDGRRTRNGLTPEAEALLPELDFAMARWEAACYQGLAPGDIEAFARISAHIVANVMKPDPETPDNPPDGEGR